MAKTMHSKKSFTVKKVTQYQHLYIIPILLLFLIYPFLAKYNNITNPITDNPSYYSTETLVDIFLYVKSEFLLFITISMLCVFVCDLVMNARSHGLYAADYKKFIPLGIYALFILLSTLFAENKQLALGGMPGQFESMWILLAYLGICIFGYWYMKTVESHTLLTYALLGGTLLMGVVFLLQFLGFDPYIWLFANHNATVAVEGVYGGFYNPNYLGSYVNLILPILIALLIALRGKKTLVTLIGITIVLTILGLYGSKTMGGVVGVIAITGFTILFLIFKKLNWSWKKFYIALTSIVVVVLIGISMYLTRAEKSEVLLYERLEAIYTNDDNLEIQHGGSTFYLSAYHTDTDFYLTCTDGAANEIPIFVEDSAYHFYDERLVHFSVTPYVLSEQENLVAFALTYGDNTWYFTNDYGDGTYYHITPAGSFVKTTPENTSHGVLFNNVPKFMSGRGYIWSQSIPMLADTLLVGYGPDCYAEYFPNYDFVAALRGGFIYTFISKPHSMYLQMALQTGILSLLAFLVFYFVYFTKSVKLYLAVNFKAQGALVGFGIFLGTVGYLVVGTINDSSITVAPFFWLLLGIGYAVNQHLQEADN